MANRFVIVRFLVLPYFGIEEYICIPESWIQFEDSEEVAVSYPEEIPSVTRERVRNNENFSRTWKMYWATVIRRADSYNDALQAMNEIRNTSQANNPTVSVDDNIDNVIASVSGLNIQAQSEVTDDNLNTSIQATGDNTALSPQSGTPAAINKRRLSRPYRRPPNCNLHIPQNTLRHPQPGQGLVEFTDGVYISEEALRLARLLTSANELARALMVAIFSDEALMNCALVGEDAVAFDRREADTRDGLHAGAREAIIQYVIDLGNEREWDVCVRRIRKTMNYELDKWRNQVE